ncbi:hypothetical protein FRC10_006641, partial [Ceratobasidium sp. 414]
VPPSNLSPFTSTPPLPSPLALLRFADYLRLSPSPRVAMPLLPLSHCLLPFLERATLQTESPFDLEPWSNPAWRRTLGLEPIPPKPDDQDDATYQQGVQTIVRRGFSLSENVGATIIRKHASDVNNTNAQRANLFLGEALEAVKTALHADQRPKESWKAAFKSQHLVTYQQFTLGLIHRVGGPWAVIGAAVRLHGNTPMHAWIDARSSERAEEYVKDLSLKARVAKEVFGTRGVIQPSGHMRTHFGEFVACLLSRTWESMKRML